MKKIIIFSAVALLALNMQVFATNETINITPKITVSEDGVELQSEIETYEDYIAINALYNDGRLVSAALNKPVSSIKTVDSAKVMVLESLDKMKPLCDAVDVSLDALTLTDPEKDVNGKVHNYSEKQFNYLNNSQTDYDNTLISSYASGQTLVAQEAVTIAWSGTQDVTGYTLKLADNAELVNAEEIELASDVTSYDLYDLYTGTDYYWQVTAKLANGTQISKTSTFTTENIGPRVVTIDGLQNTRDIGGYASSFTDSDGNPLRTKQGLVYRGGEISNSSYGNITDAGREKFLNVLGIKTDIDLRSPGEEFVRTSESPAKTANYFIEAVRGGYGQAFSGIGKVCYASAFRRFADADNYPIYVHCQGGADRTGTVVFLINALCGVAQEDLIRDFEFTSFAKYGLRTRTDSGSNKFPTLLDRIMSSTYGNDTATMAERAEAYMKSIGITDTEIANIRANMLGNAEPTSELLKATHVNDGNNNQVPVSYKLEPYTNDGVTPFTFKITNSKDMTVEAVSVKGESVGFTRNANYSISIPASDMPVEDGSYAVNVTFSGNKSFDFTVAVSAFEIVDISETGFVEAGESRTITESTAAPIALGYGKGVRMKLSNDAGGLGIKIGDYGLRMYSDHILRGHGGQQLYYIPSTYFNNTEHIVELWLTADENYVYNHINTYYANGNPQFSYTIPTPKSAVSNIASENAKVSIQLYEGATEVTVKSLVQVPTSASAVADFNYYGYADYQIKLKGFDGLEVSKLTINGTETEYTLDGTIMTVAQENMPKLDSNVYQGVVTTTDGQELAFNVIYNNVLDISDTGFMQAGESKTVTASTSATTLGTISVGYNNTLRFAMKANNKGSGSWSNLGLIIGDFGFYSRGNGMRILTNYNNTVAMNDASASSYPLSDSLMFGDSNGNPYIFELKVDTMSTSGCALVSLKVLSADGTKQICSYTRTITIPDGTTLKASSDAKLIMCFKKGVEKADFVTFTSLKNPDVSISVPDTFNRYGGEDYAITIGETDMAVKSVLINETEVEYTLTDNIITVDDEAMPELVNGTYVGKVIFTNVSTGAESIGKFTAVYDSIIDISNIGLTLAEDGSFTLTAPNSTANATAFANGTTNVGYDTKVTFNLQNVRQSSPKYNDGLFLGIGSYGVNLLTGYLRPVSKSGSSFNINWSGTSDDSLFIGNNAFVSASRKVVIWVTLESDTTAYVNMQIYNAAGTSSSTYKIPVTRISSEIASESAKFTVGLMNDSVQSIIIK